MSDPKENHGLPAAPDEVRQLRHDVRNHLFCAQMYAQLCAERFSRDQLTQSEVDDLVTAVEQLSQGVETLLTHFPSRESPG